MKHSESKNNIKKLAVFISDKNPLTKTLCGYFEDKNVEVTVINEIKDNDFFEDNEFDLMLFADIKIKTNPKMIANKNVLNIHHSLLPAFCEDTPQEKAFLSGVKVSGVTIHFVGKSFYDGKIIAQYPIFIDSTTSLEEFEEEIKNVENKLVPFVVESVLEDRIFNFGMLLKPQNQDGCGGCGGSCRKN